MNKGTIISREVVSIMGVETFYHPTHDLYDISEYTKNLTVRLGKPQINYGSFLKTKKIQELEAFCNIHGQYIQKHLVPRAVLMAFVFSYMPEVIFLLCNKLSTEDFNQIGY